MKKQCLRDLYLKLFHQETPPTSVSKIHHPLTGAKLQVQIIHFKKSLGINALSMYVLSKLNLNPDQNM